MSNRAVFIDRDGTLNVEVEYLNKIDQLKLIDGTVEALKLLQNKDFKRVVITNQSGIARGYLTERELYEIHAALNEMLRLQSVSVDAIYFCPHHPKKGIAPYLQHCDCRKPKTGMLQQAASDLGIDLSASFVIGDKPADVLAGQTAGCKTVLVLTGYGQQSLQKLDETGAKPDFIAKNLLDAVRWILGS